MFPFSKFIKKKICIDYKYILDVTLLKLKKGFDLIE